MSGAVRLAGPWRRGSVLPAGWFAEQPNWRFSALLATELLFVFVALPLLAEREVPRVIAHCCVLLATAGTILFISSRRPVQLAVLATFVLAAASHVPSRHVSSLTTNVLAELYAILVAVLVGRAVFARGKVDAHRVAGAVALYINIAVLFAAAFALLSSLAPDALSGLSHDRAGRVEDMIHFSLSTLTTLGYGDILPRTPMARSVADFEALIGQLFPATLLARLISLQISRA